MSRLMRFLMGRFISVDFRSVYLFDRCINRISFKVLPSIISACIQSRIIYEICQRVSTKSRDTMKVLNYRVDAKVYRRFLFFSHVSRLD